MQWRTRYVFFSFQQIIPPERETGTWVTTNDDLILTLRSETFRERRTEAVVVSVRLMKGSTEFKFGTYFGDKMLVLFMQRKPVVDNLFDNLKDQEFGRRKTVYRQLNSTFETDSESVPYGLTLRLLRCWDFDE